MVREAGRSEEGDRREVCRLIDRLDELVHRVSELVGQQNVPLMYQFKLTWVRLRVTLNRRYGMEMQEPVNEGEQYVEFWEMHLGEMYEVGEDMTVVMHDGAREAVCEEMLW